VLAKTGIFYLCEAFTATLGDSKKPMWDRLISGNILYLQKEA